MLTWIFGGGLRIKERLLNTVPQHSKSRTSIDDEHTVQGLQKEKFNQGKSRRCHLS